MALREVDLFGGAIQTSFPSSFVDASDFRQVPDTQEVYVDKDSDLSIIVEITERVGEAEDEAAARFHFDSLAHDNSALSSTVNSVTAAPTASGAPCVGPIVIEGCQTVSKFNRPESEADVVFIQLALWRIPAKKADLVLTLNCPEQSRREEAVAYFQAAAKGLQIEDFDLFAEPE